MSGPVVLVAGADEVLRAAKRSTAVAEALAGADPSLAIAELAGEGYELRELVDAAQTPPFFTDHRVVVGRDLARFKSKDALAPLLGYLEDPLPTTVLVLEWDGATPAKSLRDAVVACGGQLVQADPGRKLDDFVGAAFSEAGLRPDREATRLVIDWLGDEPGRLPGLCTLLAATYGPGAGLRAEDISPFLGDGGGVPPWDLTDAIDRGDIPASISTATRMLRSGRHPLQLLATLHSHYQRILRLDGASVRTEQEAATVLGMKGSTFPAKKALAQSRKLGSTGVRDAIHLLARADLELRGTVDWPPALTVELLVARLARLSRTAR